MKRNLLILFCTFGLLFFVTRTTMAQDAEATIEAAPVSIVTVEPEGSITVEDGGTVIVNEAPVETPAPVEQKSFLSSILEFALGAIIGAGVALSSAAAWIRSAMNDPVKMTLAETAARSISPEALKQVLDFLDTSRAFVVEATDGVPMITKPTPPANPSDYTSTSSVSQDGM